MERKMIGSYYGKAFVEGETFEGTTVIKKKADQEAAKEPKAAAKKKAEA